MLTQDEERILKSIKVHSSNDPKNPEFPFENPKFPATPSCKIKVPGFTNVWLKDESHNSTGTHKDRMAWEMVVNYREFLISKKLGNIKKLPQMSIITSGSAGYAIQSALKKFNLPNLKCLVDFSLDSKTKESLVSIGCELFEVDLSRKSLEWDEILSLTNNPEGIDITSSEALDPGSRYYDWLSYEIVNLSPEYCLIPFGTGNLYENILNIVKKEITAFDSHDPRFKGNIDKLRKCHFIGATTNNPKSKAIKLYSAHLPFVHFDEQWISFYRQAAYCGNQSQVYILKEIFLEKAIQIAQNQKIVAEPSGLAGLAMLLQMKNQIPENAKILIVNTGKTKY